MLFSRKVNVISSWNINVNVKKKQKKTNFYKGFSFNIFVLEWEKLIFLCAFFLCINRCKFQLFTFLCYQWWTLSLCKFYFACKCCFTVRLVSLQETQVLMYLFENEKFSLAFFYANFFSILIFIYFKYSFFFLLSVVNNFFHDLTLLINLVFLES